MEELIKVGDVVALKSELRIKMTVINLRLDQNRLEAAFWNVTKGEFQTIVGCINAFQKVNG